MKKNAIMTVLFFLVIPLFLSAQERNVLKTGDTVPLFSAMDDSNREWALKDYLGKKNIVVYFYPAAMTGGCTIQACAYRDDYENIENADAIVVGISGDEVENLQLFKKAYDLNFPLLSDPKGEIAGKFGVPYREGGSIQREIEGTEFTLNRGVTSVRWTFIIDKQGKISYINQEVDAANDSQNVLQMLKGLNE